MRRLFFFLSFIALSVIGAVAQVSESGNVIPSQLGIFTNAGCPTMVNPQTYCFIPYNLANPLPVSTVAQGYSYTHISTDTTTLVKTGSGLLHAVCVNTGASGATITIDDALTATTPTIAVMSGATAVCNTYDVSFATGLTVVTGTAAADVTIVWK